MIVQLFTMFLLANLTTFSHGADPDPDSNSDPDLKMFALPAEGQKRFVIKLPHKERGEEDNFRVELIVGKMVLTDGVNQHRLGASFERDIVKGWGYPYYRVTGNFQVAGTLMAPPPGTPKTEQFVSGEPMQIRYNSRIPVVVYVPDGMEVRYRIWSAPETTEAAEIK